MRAPRRLIDPAGRRIDLDAGRFGKHYPPVADGAGVSAAGSAPGLGSGTCLPVHDLRCGGFAVGK
jgi:hypothetical protein